MNPYEKWQLVIQACSFLIIGGGLFYTARQIILLRKVHSDNHEWNRRKAAQDATLLFKERVGSTRDLEIAFNYFDRKNPVTIEEIESSFKDNPELKTSLHRLLNFYESLARGISTKIYDEKIIRTAWDGPMIRTYYKFYAYIEYRRNAVSPGAWKELESIINKWKHESTSSDLSLQYERIGS